VALTPGRLDALVVVRAATLATGVAAGELVKPLLRFAPAELTEAAWRDRLAEAAAGLVAQGVLGPDHRVRDAGELARRIGRSTARSWAELADRVLPGLALGIIHLDGEHLHPAVLVALVQALDARGLRSARLAPRGLEADDEHLLADERARVEGLAARDEGNSNSRRGRDGRGRRGREQECRDGERSEKARHGAQYTRRRPPRHGSDSSARVSARPRGPQTTRHGQQRLRSPGGDRVAESSRACAGHSG